MDVDAVPAIVGSHHDQIAGGDCGRITGGMHFPQSTLVGQVVELIAPPDSATVTEEMLRRHQCMARCEEVRGPELALHSGHHGACIVSNGGWIFGITVV